MNFWRGKKVFITGHTGFKGSWLSLWLLTAGAEVSGLALAPHTTPSLFQAVTLGNRINSVFADITDLEQVRATLERSEAEVIFHLAAQPLVRHSYADPVGTYKTNVVGTAHLLEAARRLKTLRAIIVVTSDKCYDNKEWEWAYRETDTLGGRDPYSNSKACAELVVSAYRQSFFSTASFPEHRTAIASVRAGNVIGGGDWADDRLLPDAVRALSSEAPVLVRNPRAVRPWQHVLEPLHGYLLLAERLAAGEVSCGEAWNFGPENTDLVSVADLMDTFCELWGRGARWHSDGGSHPHEAHSLRLDSSKARNRLLWRPCLSLRTALGWTVDWYRNFLTGSDIEAFTVKQIEHYECLVNGRAGSLSSAGVDA